MSVSPITYSGHVSGFALWIKPLRDHVNTSNRKWWDDGMLGNLFLGTALIVATVVIHTFGLIWTTQAMGVVTSILRTDGRRNRMVAMITTVLGVFATLTVEIWLWALVHYAIGVVGDFESALYFSAITFSTLGYGDIVPPHEWRLLAGLEGISGFLLVGWSTAYLVSAGMRVGPFRAGEHF
jgi:hypothetical protein